MTICSSTLPSCYASKHPSLASVANGVPPHPCIVRRLSNLIPHNASIFRYYPALIREGNELSTEPGTEVTGGRVSSRRQLRLLKGHKVADVQEIVKMGKAESCMKAFIIIVLASLTQCSRSDV